MWKFRWPLMWVKTHDKLVGELIMLMISKDKIPVPKETIDAAIAEFEKRRSTIH